MDRRSLLKIAGGASTALLAGCGWNSTQGSNPLLLVINMSDSGWRGSVEIVDRETDRTTLSTTITVAERAIRKMQPFRESRYQVTVSDADSEISFDTRPICNTAHTWVTIAEDGTLEADVAFCE